MEINYNNRLLKLSLIKSQQKENKDQNILFNEIKYLKIALRIIYKYHVKNKKILFIGLSSSSSNTTTARPSHHIYYNNAIWLRGSLMNKSNIFTSIIKNKTKQKIKNRNILLKLIQKPNLVVIVNKKTDKEALNEFYAAKIPVITLNSDFNFNDFKSSYEVPNSFKTESGENNFNTFITSILERKTKQQSSLTKLNYTKKGRIEYKNKKWIIQNKLKNNKKRQNRNYPRKNTVFKKSNSTN